jgi:hypothetical protein
LNSKKELSESLAIEMLVLSLNIGDVFIEVLFASSAFQLELYQHHFLKKQAILKFCHGYSAYAFSSKPQL